MKKFFSIKYRIKIIKKKLKKYTYFTINQNKTRNKKIYRHYVIYYYINSKFNKSQIKILKISVLIHSKTQKIINSKTMNDNQVQNNSNNKNAKKRRSLEQTSMITDETSEITETPHK